MDNIFKLVERFAADLRAIDPRIKYAPVSIHEGDVATVLQVDSDAAVHELANRLSLGPVAGHSCVDAEWIAAEGAHGNVAIGVMGPHRRVAVAIEHPATLEIVQ